MFGRNRRLLVSDFFVSATALWIVVAAVYTDGTESLSSAVAESIELLGGYVVARGFFFGPLALHKFLSVLKVFACHLHHLRDGRQCFRERWLFMTCSGLLLHVRAHQVSGPDGDRPGHCDI